jgi:acetyl-CoA acyltransferase
LRLGVTAIQMAADRIRVGEADVMIAGGAESMSMVPMGGNKPSSTRGLCRDENVGIAYGMGLTAEKVAQQWKVSREAQDAFALESHRAPSAPSRGEFADEITPIEIVERSPTSPPASRDQDAHREPGRRPAPRHLAGRPGQAQDRVRRARQRHGGNSSQTSDGAGALILASEKAVKQFGLTPLARFVSYAARRAARDHGHRPHRGHSRRAALRRPAVPDDIGWSS